MTLQELSVEYRAHARALDFRICQLQAVLDRTEDETVTLQEDELGEGTWFDRSELPEGGSSISLTHEMIERFRQGPV